MKVNKIDETQPRNKSDKRKKKEFKNKKNRLDKFDRKKRHNWKQSIVKENLIDMVI